MHVGNFVPTIAPETSIIPIVQIPVGNEPGLITLVAGFDLVVVCAVIPSWVQSAIMIWTVFVLIEKAYAVLLDHFLVQSPFVHAGRHLSKRMCLAHIFRVFIRFKGWQDDHVLGCTQVMQLLVPASTSRQSCAFNDSATNISKQTMYSRIITPNHQQPTDITIS